MIEITNLVKKYGANIAVNDISFSVPQGEIVGFLGPNGAGKTTTMNILTGYLSATTGSAKIGGYDILENPGMAKKHIGFLPEQPPLYLDMTVKEYLNFTYNLKNCKFNRVKHLQEICEVVKITDVYKRMIKNLSKGYRQRVGIAQALIGNPQVLIFDEPTVGLDPKQIIDIRNLIRALGRDHTIILSTHILPEVQAICDRIVIINQGEIVANEKTEDISKSLTSTRRFIIKIAGPKNEVLSWLKSREDILYAEFMREQRDEGSTAFLVEGQPDTEIRQSLFYGLAEKNWPIMGLENMGMSLEDIFIRLVTGRAGRQPAAARQIDGSVDENYTAPEETEDIKEPEEEEAAAQ
ncbi:MAG: ABC transporter ATP-binding protein [Oscillospiraceae bacterium]|nr:ABC transporter ATP-binding protein [Oscillospiraceae bacterium]